MKTIALDYKSKMTIIQGPQGSGKTTLAHMISNRSMANAWLCKGYNGPTSVEGRQFFSDPKFTVFPMDSKVVIVDGVELTYNVMDTIKELANSIHFVVERQGREAVKIATPHFIFCVTDDEYNSVGNYADTSCLENIQFIDLGAR